MPTVAAIIGNKLAPALLDWYLAKTGYNAAAGLAAWLGRKALD